MTDRSDAREDRSRRRAYPPFWEKAVPIVLTVIAFIIVVLIVIIVGVALGLFPGIT